ncbi:MAG: hypothetical protein ABW063_15920 [Caulobacter sp.]
MLRALARALRRFWSSPDDPRSDADVVPHFHGGRQPTPHNRPWSVRRTIVFGLVVCIPIWVLIAWLLLH